MPSDEDRLYLDLFARGGAPIMDGKEDMYHWALTTGPAPRSNSVHATRYHVKNIMTTDGMKWQYEEKEISLEPSSMILVSILVGKMVDGQRFKQVVSTIKIIQGNKAWNCVVWIRSALEALEGDRKAMGTRQLDWKIVRGTAMTYCQEKRDQRRFETSYKGDRRKVPTFDLLERKEVLG